MTILEILRELNVPYVRAGEHKNVRSGWAATDCPRCSPGWKHFRLGFALDGFGCSCWLCGKLPRIVALHELTGLPYEQLRAMLGDAGRGKREEKTRGRLVIPPGVGPLQDCHKRYLESRRVCPRYAAETWGVQGIGLARRLAWRLFIPIPNALGKTISWTTRATTEDTKVRYVSAKPEEEAESLKSVLYGMHLAKSAVVVVEGPVDAWRIGPGAVATLGVAFSRRQRFLLSRYASVAVCFDSERAAQQRAERLRREIRGVVGRACTLRLDSKDAGSADEKEISQVREYCY